ncbi:MAG: hypothetical protein QXG98_00425 [Candidatus Micrarchaeia archaeon]
MVLESRESRAIGLGALGALVLAYAFYSLAPHDAPASHAAKAAGAMPLKPSIFIE